MTGTLTPQQDEAMGLILEFLKDGDPRREFTLAGYAGTGKTFLLGHLASVLSKNEERFLMCSTTNKSLRILRGKVSAENSSTIHSHLKIRPVRRGDREVFVPMDDARIPFYDIIIVDEASMISKELLGIMRDRLHEGTKIVYVGDYAQLPPIGEVRSAVFEIPGFTLTDVVRHAGLILEAATFIRNNPDSIITMTMLKKFVDGKAVNLITSAESVGVVPSMFISEGYVNDINYTRYMCWRNEAMLNANKAIQTALGRHFTYQKGDRLMASTPIIRVIKDHTTGRKHSLVLLENSDECVVDEAEMRLGQFWHIDATTLDGEKISFRVIAEEYKDILAGKLQDLAAKKYWSEYWELREMYSNVQHAHAMTVHKSQGSTFGNPIMSWNDINRNRKTTERNQLLYVALTRASESITIVH